MNLYRLRAMRRQRREDADAAAEERFQQCVGDVFGLSEADGQFLPPSVQVGWKEPSPSGGVLCCLACAPQPPTVDHVPVWKESYFAVQPCAVCGHRLEQAIP
jgi:hypothetical protein